jgi:hypothetical protein
MNKIVAEIDFHHCDFWLDRLFSAFRIGFQSDKFNFLTTIK